MRKQKTHPDTTAAKRHTLGVLLDNLSLPWSWRVWQGMAAGAREQDANLICFLGSWLYPPDPNERQANVIYQFASSQIVDGLALHHGGMGTYVAMPDFAQFLQQYGPIPMVCVEDGPADIPSVHWDGYEGMRKVLIHLI